MKGKKRFGLIAILALALCSLFAFAACEFLIDSEPDPGPEPEPQKYAVNFELDEDVEGTISGIEESYAAGENFYLPSADALTKEGFTFVCWNDSESDYAAGAEYTMPAHAVTFTAKWNEVHKCTSECPDCGGCTNDDCREEACSKKCPGHFTVTFVLGEDVEGTIEGFEEKIDAGTKFNLPSADALTKKSFKFDCWNDGDKDYAAGAEYTMPKGNVTFTAKWTHVCESECPDCGGCTNDDCHEEVCSKKCPGHFTVTFVLGEDVEGTIEGFDLVNKFDTNTVINLPSAEKLKRNGYTFDGWTDGETDYAEDQEYTVTEDVTFTAKWTELPWGQLYGKEARNYTNASDITGGYISGKTYAFDPARGEYLYEAEDAILGANLSTEANDARKNVSGGVVVSNFSKDERTITFEVYSVCDYTALLTIAITGNAGFGSSGKADHYFNITNSANGAALEFVDSTLVAGNWSKNPVLCAENPIGTISLVTGKNTIVIKVVNTPFEECIQMDYLLISAKLHDIKSVEPAQVTVSYDLDGANGTIPAAEYSEGAIITVAGLGDITREGYLFDGYSDGAKHYVPGDVIIVGKEDIKLTAQWKKDPRPEWKETYGALNKSPYVDGDNNAFVPARGAYIFEAENAILGSGLDIESNKPNASGNKQLGGLTTAKRTVTFKVYSVSDYTALISLGYTTNAAFSTTTFADHFMTITYGDGKTVYCGSTVLNAGDWTGSGVYVESYIGEIELSAGWNTIEFTFMNLSHPNNMCLDYMLLMPKLSDISAQQTYTLSYDVNSGNGSAEGGEYYEGAFVTLASDADLSREGYYFAGWSYDGKTYQAGDTFIMPKGNVTLTAVWEQNEKYAVTYSLDGGTGAEDTEVMAGSRFNLPQVEDVTKEGYTLGGWLYNNTYYAAGATFVMPEEAVTFTAIWIADMDLWDSIYGAADSSKNYTKVSPDEGVFEFDSSKGTHLYEAEDATLRDGLGVESNKVNASGNKQVAGFDKNSHTFLFEINAAKSGTVLLTIGYTGNPASSGTLAWSTPASNFMTITNGEFVLDCSKVTLVEANWSGNGIYVECRLGVVYLNEGVNTLSFTFVGWDWPTAIAMDYILLTPEMDDAAEQTDTMSAAQESVIAPQEMAYRKEN